MQISKLMNELPLKNFEQSYLEACGVKSPVEYMAITSKSDVCDNPFDYPNMEEAVTLLFNRINKDREEDKETQFISIVDCDVDGYCANAIIYTMLYELGCLSLYTISHTGKEHGFDNEVMQELESFNPKESFIFCTDAGSTDEKNIALLKSKGFEVIVLDHHDPKNCKVVDGDNYYYDPSKFPCYNINHHFGKKDFENDNPLNIYLSGAGVTMKFVQAYCQKFDLDWLVNWKRLESLVGLSILSDSCDIRVAENRYYVQRLRKLDMPILSYIYECRRKPTKQNPKGSRKYISDVSHNKDWSFGFIPYINALTRRSGELENKMFVAFAMASETKEDFEKMMQICTEAKKAQQEDTKDVLAQIEENIIVTDKLVVGFIDKEYKSMTGVIAGKLCDTYNRPAFILREKSGTEWSGSLRSTVDLLTELNNSKLCEVSGHEKAAGIVIKKAMLNKVIEFVNNMQFETSYDVACQVCIKDINLTLVSECDKIAQYIGKGIPSPLFYYEGTLEKPFVSRKTKNTCLCGAFVKFNCSDEEADKFEKSNYIRCVFELRENTYNGETKAQAVIKDMELSFIEPRAKKKTFTKGEDLSNEDWMDLF